MWYEWRPYVSVAQRRRKAQREIESLRKKGKTIEPIQIQGRAIAKTFWGKAWCDHLESFSDYANRLPRGRTYVRNGSVCHLGVSQGEIEAKVCGSELYTVRIKIKPLPAAKWKAIKQQSSGQIGTLLELLEGKLSDHVMEVVTDRQQGLFPLTGEISLQCSCPDGAWMCKHVAAVLYGVGSRLDAQPDLLFTLRGVNHEELIEADAEKTVAAVTSRGKSKRIAEGDLGDVFGIDLAEPLESAAMSSPVKQGARRGGRKEATATKRAPAGAKKARKARTPEPSEAASLEAKKGSQRKGRGR